jgi:hypothetical protein
MTRTASKLVYVCAFVCVRVRVCVRARARASACVYVCVCVCVCVCIHTHIQYKYIYIYTHTYIYIYRESVIKTTSREYMYIYIYIYIYIHTYTCMPRRMYTHAYTKIQCCRRSESAEENKKSVHIYIHTHRLTRIHTYTNTHTNSAAEESESAEEEQESDEEEDAKSKIKNKKKNQDESDDDDDDKEDAKKKKKNKKDSDSEKTKSEARNWSRMCGGASMPSFNIMSSDTKSATKDATATETGGKKSKDSKAGKGKDRSCTSVMYANMPSLTSAPSKDDETTGRKLVRRKGRAAASSDEETTDSDDEVKGWRRKVEKEALDDGITGWSAVSFEDEMMIKAGIAGLGVVADGVRTNEKMGITPGMVKNQLNGSKGGVGSGIQHMKCGVGLVLESWRPRGLALALNVLARTHEAVRVEQVRCYVFIDACVYI